MPKRSRLVRLKVTNIGCIGPDGLTVDLDDILCLVGPNNTGKSTILKAYELATGKATFIENDLCKRAGNQPATIELWVHIPTGTPNIAEKWKTPEGDLLLVRSKWEWKRETRFTRTRTTWDPETNDWSEDTKASGLDQVFGSRLPEPLRIGTLQDPKDEHGALLKIVLQPIEARLKALQQDASSELSRALEEFMAIAQKLVEEGRQQITQVKDNLNRAQTQIFPHLTVDIDVNLGKIEFDLTKELDKNSGVSFTEWADQVKWSQQGTGSQRALFWALLQVRSKLQTLIDLQSGTSKSITELEKQKTKLQKEVLTAKKPETRTTKEEEIKAIDAKMEELRKTSPESLLAAQATELALPGYMLLIDEPEVGLHPGAIRAASRYLYSLVEDPAWQVILTTHAPLFIDPLQDHTTIVRLARNQANPTPNTYRAADVGFSEDDKENLKMLNRFDQGLAEMFFGQYPILIEGDTEFACFDAIMQANPESYPVATRPVLVQARGKHTLPLIIRMLRHFKVPFSVLHDSDTPFCMNGNSNLAWNANREISREIDDVRAAGIRVVHRVSIPTFELAHAPATHDENGHVQMSPDRDKLWKMLSILKTTEETQRSVRKLLEELISSSSEEQPFSGDLPQGLESAIKEWGQLYSPGDIRFSGRSHS